MVRQKGAEQILTGVESGLQGGKPVVFEHVQQSLENMSHAEQVFKVPSSRFFQHCRDRGREFLRSYATDLWLGVQHVSLREP